MTANLILEVTPVGGRYDSKLIRKDAYVTVGKVFELYTLSETP
jgi:hypothetical protein